MIRVLILYYLNIKPTHGYEIQKFIKYTQLDTWTKIQSGSIYYALEKLQKEGMISLLREESIGSKVRKIFEITTAGKGELEHCMQEELNKEIFDVGSDKFILYPFLNSMNKDMIKSCIKLHISALEERRSYFKKWELFKVQPSSLQVETLSFEMILSSLDYQIRWHNALLNELDECLLLGKKTEEFIKQVDFTTMNEDEIPQLSQQDTIKKLKQEILSQPAVAEKKLEELIKLLKK